MLELKNFYVKHGGKFPVENVNFQFRSPNKYSVICANDAQKEAFIGGLLGYVDYPTFGSLIWESKWKLETQDTAKRMANRFFLFTDKIPNLDFLTVGELLANLGRGLSKYRRQKINSLAEHYGLPHSFLCKKVGANLEREEKQKMQLMELCFSRPKFVIIDLEKPIVSFFRYLSASTKSFSVIMVISIPGAKFNIIKQ